MLKVQIPCLCQNKKNYFGIHETSKYIKRSQLIIDCNQYKICIEQLDTKGLDVLLSHITIICIRS